MVHQGAISNRTVRFALTRPTEMKSAVDGAEYLLTITLYSLYIIYQYDAIYVVQFCSVVLCRRKFALVKQFGI